MKVLAVDLFSAAKNLISLAPAVNVKCMMITVNLLLQLAPAELWGEALHVSGLFVDIVKALEEEKVRSLHNPCDRSPIIIDQASSTLLMEYVFFMARIALGNSQVFRELIKKAMPVLNESEEQLYNIVLTQWWTRVSDNQGYLVSTLLSQESPHFNFPV